MAFLTKRPEVSFDDLIDHYENHHVPLILSLGPPPAGYRRNYVLHDLTRAAIGGHDVITELEFADAATYQAWVAAMYASGSGVAEDEATFLDRSRTTSYVVDEHITAP